MGIVKIAKGAALPPVILCDTYGEPITDPKAASVLYRRYGHNQDELLDPPFELLFIHRRLCDPDRQSERREKPDEYHWEPLDIFLYHLLRNAGYTAEIDEAIDSTDTDMWGTGRGPL